MVIKLTPQVQSRIGDAIAAAEAKTSGEIFCVLARRVSSYRDISLGWAAAAALLLPLGLIPFGFDPAWIPGMGDGWQAAHLSSTDVVVGQSLAAYALIQSAVFVTAFLLTSIPGVRRFVTPRSVRRARVRRAAMEQFLAHGLHITRERTGVLIFAALADHQVEVVADEGIHSKVDQAIWADAVEALAKGMKNNDPAAGFEVSIGLCGDVLAEHFPPRTENPNEIEDRLVLI
ncbi:TPM domain-containing protein [Aquidulcibacter paucihalophilus]|nr:TPM domain-containing protein [Aquidulcibacter paucihalophilus]